MPGHDQSDARGLTTVSKGFFLRGTAAGGSLSSNVGALGAFAMSIMGNTARTVLRMPDSRNFACAAHRVRYGRSCTGDFDLPYSISRFRKVRSTHFPKSGDAYVYKPKIFARSVYTCGARNHCRESELQYFLALRRARVHRAMDACLP